MKVAVQGLWHLGCVTAAATAKTGHQVIGLAETSEAAEILNQAKAPIQEPGLNELMQEQIEAGRLSFTADPVKALAGVDVLWVTFDTPVDEFDRADTGYVLDRVRKLLPLLPRSCTILLSSQLPVGSAKVLQINADRLCPGANLRVACSPENLRLGAALNVFLEPDRIVVGTDDDATRVKLTALFSPISSRLAWMSVASAEMTKHAVNAFLATSVVFINEIAALCETNGADAGEVARGLKTEQRIGPKAYLNPGAAFAGGTLARDLRFLSGLAKKDGRLVSLFGAAIESNTQHSQWPMQALTTAFPQGMHGKRVVILGLTYKAGTDTLRRSPAMELAQWLKPQGGIAVGCDVLINTLPSEAQEFLELESDFKKAIKSADVVVLFHPWPDLDNFYAELGVPKPAVIDPHGYFPGGPPHGCPYYAKVGYVSEAAA